MTIGYPDYGGVNLVKSPQSLVVTGVTGIGAGLPDTHGPFTAVGTSYAINVEPSSDAGFTLPFMTVVITIRDPSGQYVEEIHYDLPCSTVATNCAYLLSGPLDSNEITIQITNQDTVAGNYVIRAYSTNIIRRAHSIQTSAFDSVAYSAGKPPNCDPAKGILGTWYQNPVGAGVSIPFIVPPAPGPVSIGVRADDATNDVSITAAPLISQNGYVGLANGNLLTGRTDANGNFMATVNFPRSAMVFDIQNKGAAAQGISTTIVYDVTSG